MALIDKETIRAEIKRRIKFHYKDGIMMNVDRIDEDEIILAWLDTLPEQPVEGLEEVAKEYEFSCYQRACFHPEHKWPSTTKDAFIAGAEWQKKLDDLETADLLAIAHLQGMEQQKAKMLEGAVGKYVHELYTDEEGYHGYISLGTEYAPGDKVRVIVIKED